MPHSNKRLFLIDTPLPRKKEKLSKNEGNTLSAKSRNLTSWLIEQHNFKFKVLFFPSIFLISVLGVLAIFFHGIDKDL